MSCEGHQEAESHALLKLPSAVTVAGKTRVRSSLNSSLRWRGEPVAASGDMIYLGGGLYACAESSVEREKKVKRPRKPRRCASRQVSEAEQSTSPHSEGQVGEEGRGEPRGVSRNGSIGSSAWL